MPSFFQRFKQRHFFHLWPVPPAACIKIFNLTDEGRGEVKKHFRKNKKFNSSFSKTRLAVFMKKKKIKDLGYDVSLLAYLISLGISIPHYCYHNNLSIVGNCRMCVVEMSNLSKPIVSCAISAGDCIYKHDIYHNSPLVKKARENVMEFLLLNHPLDCPVCDQGGECDLQDQSLFFGFTKRRFYRYKRAVPDKNLGAVVKTVLTRCIHCTRCVRFTREIAGSEELGLFGRGVNSEIGTFVGKSLATELSGNVIDICPVGKIMHQVESTPTSF